MNVKPMLIFHVDADLLGRLDDYRFRHRFPARTTAARFLLDAALKFDPKPEAGDLVLASIKTKAKAARKEKK